MISVSEFYAHCGDQRTQLHERFEGWRTDNFFVRDRNLHGIIRSVGTLLREEPESRLAVHPLDEEIWEHDTAARTLRQLINTSIQPEAPPSAAYCFPLISGRVEVCSSADISFANVIARLSEYRYGDEIAPCVIHEQDSRPVILQKGGADGQYSGLTLAETWIGSVRYPAGSIVRVEYPDMKAELRYRDPKLPPRPAARPAEAITGLSFQRLSVFAFSPVERRQVFSRICSQGDPEDKAFALFCDASAEVAGQVTAQALKVVNNP